MLWAFSNHAGDGALNVCPGVRGGSSEQRGPQGWGHGQGALLGGVAGAEQPRRSPGAARVAPGAGGRGAPRAGSGAGGSRARAAPHQVLGRAAAGAGAQLLPAALHRRRREAALGRRAEPLPEPDKNLVSESPYEVQTPDSRCQDRSSFLELVFALSLLPRHGCIQLSSRGGCQCPCYLCCFPSPGCAKPCLVVTFCSSSVSSAGFAKSSFTTASRARIVLLLFCASSSDSKY